MTWRQPRTYVVHVHSDRTIEQMCRDLLERCGVDGAQELRSTDIVELANLVAAAMAVSNRQLAFDDRLSPRDRHAVDLLDFAVAKLRTLGF